MWKMRKGHQIETHEPKGDFKERGDETDRLVIFDWHYLALSAQTTFPMAPQLSDSCPASNRIKPPFPQSQGLRRMHQNLLG